MNTTDQNIEAEIRAKGANVAPRITPADIEAQISAEFYLNGYDFADSPKAGHIRHNDNRADEHMRLLTMCVLVLNNGYTVVGHSACVSAENFDVEIGVKVARANAVEKIWPLMGYELRSKLAQAAPLTLPVIDQATLNTKE
ncbi:Gp49 family protein [Curvibacter lanceolatus]|uniref:Gp49 family protein n=1 Tax=Curvibacter lanceolatus TaxID=86182 RepID=UPI0003761A9E|nr:Gp49 family protein [Curvibacter lanceolatus]